ncbi:MAG: acetylxylan esterase, partial [Bacteroidota bacterium]
FPHWFLDDFHARAGRDSLLLYDQDWLLAAIAPRKLLVSSASEDSWADPAGEFAALWAALPVYRLYNPKAALPSVFPPPRDGHSYGAGPVGFHLRAGPHDLRQADFVAFVALLRR